MSQREYKARWRHPKTGQWHWYLGSSEDLDDLWGQLSIYRNGPEPATEIEIGVMEFKPVLNWKDHR